MTVHLDIKKDCFFAEFSNLGLTNVPITDDYPEKYDRLLCGGIWCIVPVSYTNLDVYKRQVYAIQESNSINRAHLKYFGAGMDDIEKNAAKMQLEGLLDTLTDAKEYGSILNVESYNWDLLRRFVVAEDTDGQISMDSVGVEDTAEQLNRLIDIDVYKRQS